MGKLKFLLFSEESASRFRVNILWVGGFFEKFLPSISQDLEKAEVELPAKNFLTACVISSIAYAFAVFLAFSVVGIASGSLNILLSLFSGIVFLAVFLGVTFFSPKITAGGISSEIDQGLILALRSMLVQISSGSSLYDAMVSIAKSNYGVVSFEFKKVIQGINSGDSEIEALEKIALNSKSDYLSKACWQILTALRSGSSLANSITSVVDLLLSEQERSIKNYSSELNLFVLLYLLFAAAIPTLGVTFLVIFSSLGGAAVGDLEVLEIIIVAFITQAILIGFVKSRVPKIFD